MNFFVPFTSRYASVTPRRCVIGMLAALALLLGYALWQARVNAQSSAAWLKAAVPAGAEETAFQTAKRGAPEDAAARRAAALQQRCAMGRYATATGEWRAPGSEEQAQGWQTLGPALTPQPTAVPCDADPASNALRFLNGAAQGETLYASTASHGLLRVTTESGAWQQLQPDRHGTLAVASGDGLYLARATADAKRLLIERSEDDGRSFQPAANGLDDEALWQPPLLLDPNDAQRLWTGGRRLWQTRDGGRQWRAASAPLPGSAANRVSALAVPAGNSGNALAGTSEGHILHAYNTWAADESSAWMAAWLSAQPRAGFVTALLYEPENANRAYAAYATAGGAHVWRSDDGGASWLPADGAGLTGLPDAPVLSLALDPLHPQTIFAGTDVGLFVSPDGGAHWAVAAAPFGAAVIPALTVTQAGTAAWLNVFVDGQSVWRLALAAAQQQCTYAIEPTSRRIEAAGGGGSFMLTTGANCPWTVTSSAPGWLSVAAPASGVGSATITYIVATNSTREPRQGNLLVGGKLFTVEQGVPGGSCVVTPLTSGVRVKGTLMQGDCIATEGFGQVADFFSFNGKSGDVIALELNSAGFNGALRLFSPLAELLLVVGLDRRSPQVRLPEGNSFFSLPVEGQYRVEASGGGLTGDYTIELTLVPASCVVATLLPASQSFNAAGGPGAVQVAAGPGCPWTARADAAWVTINNGANQYGSQTLTYSVAPNLGGYRTATLTIAGLNFTVEEAGLNGSCVPTPITSGQTINATFSGDDCRTVRQLSGSTSIVAVKRYAFNATAGQRLFTALTTANPQAAQPSSALFNAGGRLLGESDGVSSFARNTFTIPADGVYLIEIVGGNNLSFSFTLNLVAAGCSVSLAPARSTTVDPGGGAGAFDIATASGCGWRASTGASWIALPANPGGTGNGRLAFSVAPNPAAEYRREFIYVNGQAHLVEQAGANGVCAARALANRQSLSGALAENDCRSQYRFTDPNYGHLAERFTFSGAAGQFAAFRFSQLGFEAHLYLIDAAGQIVSEFATPRLNEFARFTLPAAGNYVIELTTRFARATGAYAGEFQLAGTLCADQVTPAAFVFDAAAAAGSADVVTTAGCAWTAHSNASWLTISEGAAGSGTGAVKFNLAANHTTVLRRGTLTLNEQSILIEQAGLGGNCVAAPLTIGQPRAGSLSNADCRARYGNPSFGQLPQLADYYAVSLQANDLVTATAAGQSAFVTLALYDTAETLLSSNVSTNANRLPVQGYLTIPRSGVYLLEVSASAPTNYTVTLAASAPGCAVTLNVAAQAFASAGGAGSLSFTTAANCNWRALADAAWITLANPSGSGPGKVDFTLAPNQIASARSGVILLNGQTFTISQAGLNGNCLPVELPPNTTLNARLDPADCPSGLRPGNLGADRYRFNYTEGQLIAITTLPPANQPQGITFFDLVLSDSAGRTVAQSRVGPARLPAAAETFLALPATGTYFLEAVTLNQGAFFEYRLTLNVANDCRAAVLPTEARAETAETTGSFKLLTNAGCAWSASVVNAPWLTLTGAANGAGPVTLGYRAAANTGAARRGVIRVITAVGPPAEFAVEQAGGGGRCGPAPLTFNQAIQGMLTQADCTSTQLQPFPNGTTQADRYAFTAQAGDTVALLEAPETDNRGEINYAFLQANGPVIGQFASFGSREPVPFFVTLPQTGEYWFEASRRADNSARPREYVVMLQLRPAGCAPRLSSQQLTFAAAGGLGSFEVTQGAGCAWGAFNAESWLALTGASGTGNGTVRFSVAANAARQARAGVIYVGEQKVLILQAGAEGSCAVTPITPGRPVSGTLNESDCLLSSVQPDATQANQRQRADRYSFSGKAGEQFYAHLFGSGPSLRLFAADGKLLAQSFNNSFSPAPLLRLPDGTDKFTLPRDDTYFLDVFDDRNFASADYRVTLSLGCDYALSEATRFFPLEGGAGSLRLTTASGCPWTAVASANWITLGNPSGTGSATINFSVAPNDIGVRRTANLFVAGTLVEIQQAAAGGSCAAQPLTLNRPVTGALDSTDCPSQFPLPSSSLPTFRADRYSFTAAANQQVRIQLNDGANPFVTLSDAAGVVLGQFLPPDRFLTSGASLPAAGFLTLPRAGTYQIEIASAGVFTYTLLVSAAPVGCTYALTPGTQSFNDGAQSGAFTVSTASGCPWTAVSSADWLTVTNGSGTGAATVNFTLAANTADALRTASIQLADQRLDVTQAGRTGRCAPAPITAGQAVTGTLGAGDCTFAGNALHRYSFTGRAGERFRIALTLPGVTFGALTLLAPNDVPVARVPAGNGQPPNIFVQASEFLLPGRGTAVLPVTGVYTIELVLNGSVSYTLKLDLLNACAFTAALAANTSVVFEAGGGTGTLAIATSANCDWALNSSVPWITTTVMAFGTGNGTAAFTVLPNPQATPRTGQLLYPGGSLTITQQARAAVTSAASFQADELASESIGALFGQGLAKTSAAALTTPLPVTLADTVVRVRDRAGVTRDAPLFAVTPGQINFLVPAASATGAATILVVNGGVTVASGTFTIATVTPGLFAANADGQGAPAGVVLRVRNGAQTFEPLAAFEPMRNRFVPQPLDLGPPGDEVFLLLFGTGWRNRAPNGPAGVTLGGVAAPLSYAGAQGGLAGLDQLNVRVPRELAGRGLVNLVFTVDGKAANSLQVVMR